MQPEFQQRHWDYVMGGPLLQSAQFPALQSVASNARINAIPLNTDMDAPFLLRSIAVRVQYDTTSSAHRQTGLNQLRFRFTGPGNNYLHQDLIPLNIMTPYGGQLGNPLPMQRQLIYPARSTIFVDLLNNGTATLTNLTFYFRGVKLFPLGVHKMYPYPAKLSTLNFTYLRGVSPAANTTLFNIPTSTPTNGTEFQLQIVSDGDFVLRAIQAGPTASNLSWEVFLRLKDSDGYPYSNDFVHADVLAGNATGPATYPTGNASFQAAIGTGPSVPGILYPEIYIPNRQYLAYEILRTDASFIGQGAIAQDFPIAFMGAKVFAR
jgi:hypothetical protein